MTNKYEKLINDLTDKTLSFGCRILFEDKVYLWSRDTSRANCIMNEIELVNPDDEHQVCIPYMESRPTLPVSRFTNLGHPIYIGDVLEKMEYIKNGDFNSKYTDEVDRLLLLWGKCGLTRSLQEIYEGAEVEMTGIDEHTIDYELKDPNAEALFNLLFKLGIV